ncbi:MAG: hypothetical protein K8S87_08530 [Planctomycetes bacterium]|nr:hypothetical protein [Planctomycetota bacterium]
MRVLIPVLALCLSFWAFGCNETIDDDPAEKPEIKVSDLLEKIKDRLKPFPINDIAQLSDAKEQELFAALENTVLRVDDLISIAIIRKNQGKFEPALRWLSFKTNDVEKYIEIRFRKAEILFLLGKLKEAYVLCKIEVLPDEITPMYQQNFMELKARIEYELKNSNEVQN